ncbi:MAG: maleylacetate reductase [Actinomycetales bacterium]|nr:MAG: maleylacetate reductase [Actinomycetales bacterium]
MTASATTPPGPGLVFDHVTLGQRVRFGTGRAARELGDEVARRGSRRVMVLASPRELALAERMSAGVGVTAWFDDVVQHVPVEKAEAARAVADTQDVDLLVAVGGGSTVGLAKAVALTTGLPIVAVPTTYAGSEATNVWGMTEDRVKRTGVDDRVLPGTVIYDASLTSSLPVPLSVASGLNALAHCVDSLWAPRTDPIDQALALEGARALGTALAGLVSRPDDLVAREQALYGCYLAAVAFASAGSGLHHKICHVLGGTFDLPHAETHAVVLPHVLALNGPAVPQAVGRLALALGADPRDPRPPAELAVATVDDLYRRLDAPRRLVDHGFRAADVPRATAAVLAAAPPSNPAPLDESTVRSLLTDALDGAGPTDRPSTTTRR